MDRRSFLGTCAAMLVARPAFARIRPQPNPWPRGYVSLAYDDGLDSQLDIAVPQLDAAGLRGTFYLTWDNMKDRVGEWAALARRGHELANHTMTHPCDLRRQHPASFAAREIDPLQRWLERVEGTRRGRDFAYPCDVTDLGPGTPNDQARRYSRLLRRAGILSARTSEGPPNSPDWVEHAPYRLQALALAYDTSGLDEVREYVSTAIRRSAWAILVVHEIGDGERKNGFNAPDEHGGLVRMIAQMEVPCGTVEAAIAEIG
jgi:peptidoglycan/xylan/chitin deacetylase (PgdA/CDA1 family)